MKSIKSKIALLVIICTVCASLLVGFFCFSNSSAFLKRNSADILDETCIDTASNINACLSHIEQSVNMLSDFLLKNLTDFESFKTSEDYVEDFTRSAESLILSAAENTKGAVSAYIRYNPDFTNPTSGIFLSRNNLSEPFVSIEPTDFSIYDKTDSAHVGWYYIPVSNGGPTWMSPYLNENINLYMISYVIPLFKDGENVGIVGMDILFDTITELAERETAYSTAFSMLVDSGNIIEYSGGYEHGTSLERLNNSKTSDLCAALGKNTSGSAIPVTIEGVKRFASFQQLDNGMRFILVVNYDEIYRQIYILVMIIFVITVIAVAAAAVAAFVMSSKLAKPLIALTNTARKLSAGELNVKTDIKNARGEIGILGESMSKLVERLRNYIDYIDEISVVLNDISEGNLDFKLTRDYSGDFSRIKGSLDNISESLNHTMLKINSAAGQVAIGSGTLAEGSQSFALSSAKQSEEVQSLLEAVESLNAKVNNTNANVSSAFAASESGAIGIAESSKNMADMNSAMNAIAEATEKIGNIVGTVDDIAMQTNILAINAAIEAARAGEAGAGFSVVANQVQLLASNTASATKEIAELVANVKQTVSEGTAISAKANDSLKNVIETSGTIEEKLKSIAKSSGEQTEEINNIDMSVKQISALVNNSSATAEASAATSEQMSSQAQLLHDMISRFKLKDRP